MGITKTSLDRINKYLSPPHSLLIIGCQNLYDNEHYGQIAAKYFRDIGHAVKDIDIYECNGCEIADLREEWAISNQFDMVLQHGTIEHVDGSLYKPLLNIHNSCKNLGFMIHENPKSTNWPGHGQHYFTKDFWIKLSLACGYVIMEITEEPAMGNFTDGWNVSCVLRKCSNEVFISEDRFNEIYNQTIFTS